MPRSAPSLDDDDLVAPRRPWTRERFKAALQRRYSPRLHMSLILSASGLSAMIASWSLLHLGVGSMLVRYPVAISIAYATFLVGVWTWLRAMGFIDNDGARRDASNLDGIDVPSSGGSGGGGAGGGSWSADGVGGGGGSFDGGGATASWTEGQSSVGQLVSRGGGGGSGKGGFSLDIDGDGLVLLILALALVAVIFATSGYLIYCAPDVLTEAAFGAALAGTLTRASRKQTPNAWIGGVVRKTWWPFAAVFVVALLFAGYAAAHFPQATTFRQAIALAVSQ